LKALGVASGRRRP